MLLLLLILGFLTYSVETSTPRVEPDVISFDAHRWFSAADGACTGDNNQRLGMVSDLESVSATFTSQDTVERTLGAPDRIELTNQGDVWIYCLGYNIIDFDSYHVSFDAFGNVVSTQYVQG